MQVKTYSRSLLALLLLTISLVLITPVAHAQEYSVEYKGGAESFITNESDFFAHFGSLVPGDSKSGIINLLNNTNHKTAMFFYTEEQDAANREEADKILDEIALHIVSNDNEIYSGELRALNLREAVEIAALEPGEQISVEYEISVPEELGNEYEYVTNQVAWVFQAVDMQDTTGANSGSLNGSSFDKTGETTLYIALAILLLSATSIMLLVVHRRSLMKNKEQWKVRLCRQYLLSKQQSRR